MTKNKSESRLFARFSLLTLIAVYVLILVGGIVRSTGSGMGCPDWPKCFGQLVPPTDVSELPEGYKDIYSQKRAAKNERFAKYLSALGFEETANEILNDESILVEEDFNKQKTWIEYFNRLLGVIIGLLILGTFILSVKFLKTNKSIFFVALITLILVIVQGWIGSIVVSTKLLPWIITVHMFLALVIVALLIFLVFKTDTKWRKALEVKHHRLFIIILVGCMITSLIQIALGTQVREAIDVVAASFAYANRDLWIVSVGEAFIVHRTFSWIILVLHLVLFFMLYKAAIRSSLTLSLLWVVLFAIFSGVIMAYFAIPAFIQPIHLLLGTLVFGLQFLLFLQVIKGKRELVINEL